MRDPALVFSAELARPVDAAHAHHRATLAAALSMSLTLDRCTALALDSVSPRARPMERDSARQPPGPPAPRGRGRDVTAEAPNPPNNSTTPRVDQGKGKCSGPPPLP